MLRSILRVALIPIAMLVLMLPARADDPALGLLAHRIVVDVLGAKQGDVVLITSSVQNAELMEDIAIELRKVGAWSIRDLQSDRLTLAVYNEVPPSFDSQTPESMLKMTSIISAQVNIDYESNPKLFQDISPARISAQNAAFAPVTSAFNTRSIPFIDIGNGLFPSKYTAAQWGISLDQLARIYTDGLNVDYATIRANAMPVQAAIERGHAIHVTAANGTNITFGASAKYLVVSDGRITPAMRAKGGTIFTALPAGEILFVPAPGTANGTVVYDPLFFNNTEVDGLKLTFANGRMTSMTAASGLNAVKAYYDASTAGKDEFTFVDFGLNPGVKYVAGTKMSVLMAAGMVSLGIGADNAMGADNASTFSFGSTIANATVTIDGAPLITRGALAPH